MKLLIIALLLFSYVLSTYDPTSEQSYANTYLLELYKKSIIENLKIRDWYENKPRSQITIEYHNGDTYTGQSIKGRRHGFGIYKYQNGELVIAHQTYVGRVEKRLQYFGKDVYEIKLINALNNKNTLFAYPKYLKRLPAEFARKIETGVMQKADENGENCCYKIMSSLKKKLSPFYDEMIQPSYAVYFINALSMPKIFLDQRRPWWMKFSDFFSLVIAWLLGSCVRRCIGFVDWSVAIEAAIISFFATKIFLFVSPCYVLLMRFICYTSGTILHRLQRKLIYCLNDGEVVRDEEGQPLAYRDCIRMKTYWAITTEALTFCASVWFVVSLLSSCSPDKQCHDLTFHRYGEESVGFKFECPLDNPLDMIWNIGLLFLWDLFYKTFRYKIQIWFNESFGKNIKKLNFNWNDFENTNYHLPMKRHFEDTWVYWEELFCGFQRSDECKNDPDRYNVEKETKVDWRRLFCCCFNTNVKRDTDEYPINRGVITDDVDHM